MQQESAAPPNGLAASNLLKAIMCRMWASNVGQMTKKLVGSLPTGPKASLWRIGTVHHLSESK